DQGRCPMTRETRADLTMGQGLELELEVEVEAERYELQSQPQDGGGGFNFNFEPSRRDFLGVLGGGLIVLCLESGATAQESGGGGRRREFGQRLPREIGAWLRIDEDGKVTASTGKVEVGQNARTSLAQAVADELHIPLESVRLVMGDTDRVP